MGAEISCRCSCRDSTQVSDIWADEAIPVVDTPLPNSARVAKKQGRHANSSKRQKTFSWGQPGKQVMVEYPRDSDPPFMRTVAPSGTSWGQYTRTGTSFIDPRTGALAGPWGECIAWAVIYDRTNDRKGLHSQGEAAWSVMSALETSLSGNKEKPAIMPAARKVESAARRLVEDGEPLPVINQVLLIPTGACPGQLVRTENPQTPGTYIIMQVPPFAHAGQQVLTPVPVQPNRRGIFSTSSNVTLRLGGAPAVGFLVHKVYGFSATSPRSSSPSLKGDTGGIEAEGDWPSSGEEINTAGDGYFLYELRDALEDVGEFSAHVAGDAGDAAVEQF